MRVDLLMKALPIMGMGMLGVFAVTCVIIIVVAILNKTTKDKEN